MSPRLLRIPPRIPTKGSQLIYRVTSIQLVQEGPTRVTRIYSFDSCGFHPAMRRNIELAGYKVPTPIQRYTIPAIIEGHDIIGIAQTGGFRRHETE